MGNRTNEKLLHRLVHRLVLHPPGGSNTIGYAIVLDKALPALGKHKGVIEFAWPHWVRRRSELMRIS